MIVTLAGVMLSVCFVACAAVVLATLSGVVRENEQGGHTAVSVSYAGAVLPAYYPKTVAAQPKYVGRHRRE